MKQKPPPGIDRVMGRLGLTVEPPLVRRRIEIATEFLHRHGLKEAYLKGIDFSQDVRELTLTPGLHLIAYRAGPLPGASSWNPFGLFYSEVGTSAYQLGIKPDNRLYVRFIVVKAAPALKSRAADVAVTWDKGPKYLAGGGGGWQYMVPCASGCLREVTK